MTTRVVDIDRLLKSKDRHMFYALLGFIESPLYQSEWGTKPQKNRGTRANSRVKKILAGIHTAILT